MGIHVSKVASLGVKLDSKLSRPYTCVHSDLLDLRALLGFDHPHLERDIKSDDQN